MGWDNNRKNRKFGLVDIKHMVPYCSKLEGMWVQYSAYLVLKRRAKYCLFF